MPASGRTAAWRRTVPHGCRDERDRNRTRCRQLAVSCERCHSRTKRSRSSSPRPRCGQMATCHMLVGVYRSGRWIDVEIRPYGNLPLAPSINAFQYGVAVFEGLKAFRMISNEVVLFRLRDNLQRLRRSCRRLVLPEVPEELFLGGISDSSPWTRHGSRTLVRCVREVVVDRLEKGHPSSRAQNPEELAEGAHLVLDVDQDQPVVTTFADRSPRGLTSSAEFRRRISSP